MGNDCCYCCPCCNIVRRLMRTDGLHNCCAKMSRKLKTDYLYKRTEFARVVVPSAESVGFAVGHL